MPEPMKLPDILRDKQTGITIRFVQEWDLLESQRVTVADLLPLMPWDEIRREDATPVLPGTPADA
jgi:hypothetical protein